MIVGGYSLHVYCEVCNAFDQNNQNVESKREAMKELRARGWLFTKDKCWCMVHRAHAVTVTVPAL